MEIQDILITPIYFLIIWFAARLIRARMPEGSVERKYFVPGLMVKLVGAIGVGVVYKFYYQIGDTLYYHEAGRIFNEVFWQSPQIYFQNLFSSFESVSAFFSDQFHRYGAVFLAGESTVIISKISAVFGFFCFGSYFSTALLFAVFSYSGIWALFITFRKLYPHLKTEFAIACLFVPSLFFWGSGILKDSITVSAIGWITYAVYHIFFLRKRILFSVLMILFWGKLLLLAKSYILIAFLPGLALWILFFSIKKIHNKSRRFILIGSLSVIIALGVGFNAGRIGEKIQENLIENVLDRAIMTSLWNATGYTESSQSAYELNIDKIDINSPGSILNLAPETIFLTLYRPFLWEANKIVILLSALENFIFLFFSIRLFLVRNPFRIVKKILSDPNLIFFLSFTLIFSFAMGLSSGVFGALVRYKIPMLPFFVASLFILYDRRRKV